MLKRLIHGFGLLLQAEFLMWAILLSIAGIVYLVDKFF